MLLHWTCTSAVEHKLTTSATRTKVAIPPASLAMIAMLQLNNGKLTVFQNVAEYHYCVRYKNCYIYSLLVLQHFQYI
jgi:hypothetical protein